ncbi:Lrp/AsnC ligand binding domain-containing protein [Streptomyces sviceus]|uniref:Lrp/AsnC ligand binding domain-containing protein n=1 Tax=Streptomyces sviceus TaxID=285530 RepID=UPI00382A7FA4
MSLCLLSTSSLIRSAGRRLKRPKRLSAEDLLTGNDDLLMHVAVRDTDDMHAVVLEKLAKRPELADGRTPVVYGHMRKKVIGPA